MKEDNHLTIRVSDDLLSEIESYARTNTDGNRSAAIKRLLESGLSISKATDQCVSSVRSILDESLDKMYRIASRGTKASLASLVMAASYMPSTSSIAAETGRLVIDAARKQGIGLPVEIYEEACGRSGKAAGASAEEAMDYCWRAAGRIQQAGSKPTYSAATKGLPIRKTSIEGPDFWGEEEC